MQTREAESNTTGGRGSGSSMISNDFFRSGGLPSGILSNTSGLLQLQVRSERERMGNAREVRQGQVLHKYEYKDTPAKLRVSVHIARPWIRKEVLAGFARIKANPSPFEARVYKIEPKQLLSYFVFIVKFLTSTLSTCIKRLFTALKIHVADDRQPLALEAVFVGGLSPKVFPITKLLPKSLDA